jgi:elongation factor G
MGELHLEIYAQRMEREYNCPVVMGKPKVAFRETLMRKVDYDYWHRKQTGGRGEYARVIGYFEPLPPGENTRIEFKDATKGTNVPKPFVPGVRKGFENMCEKGMLAGYRVVGLRMVLVDGANHEVDSSEWAFYQASQFAFECAFEDGEWQILEPIMLVEVSCPEEFQGSVIAMMTKRGGIIKSSDASEGWFTTEVEAPLNNMFGFASELRSGTEGKGEYTMEYARYAPAVPEVQEQLIRQYQAELQSGGGSKKKKN